MINRVIWIVIDSVGIGELPDAHLYGDEGSNTLGNIYKSIEGFSLPILESMGLGNIIGDNIIPPSKSPISAYGKAEEKSPGKDTTTGHWEMAGIILEQPFPTFPKGFSKEIIREFESKIGRKTLGNYAASGTEIIKDLGKEHMETGYPIVYTSADSVFQIAAHEDIISIELLYKYCKIARNILKGKNGVGRVIARPFIGELGSFKRTKNRRDFSLEPIGTTILDKAKDGGLNVMGVGKIEDIFAGRGLTHAIHTENNMDGVDKTISYMKMNKPGIIYTNLVDFDSLYGHRNNVKGYAQALLDVDNRLKELFYLMKDDDVLIINSDHGCDPTTISTDHSREYIPILVYGKKVRPQDIGVRKTFADIGCTIAELLQIEGLENGESFARTIIREE
jgi:phosphopentomutase